MKRNRKFGLMWVLAVATALPMSAQNFSVSSGATGTQNTRVYRDGSSWVEETTGTLASATSLRVNTDMGSISVQGGSQNDITYTIRKRASGDSEESAKRAFAEFSISTANRGGQAVIEGTSGRRHGRFNVDFQVRVPRDLRQVRANTEGGSLAMSNLGGQVDAHSGGGSFKLSDISGALTADTGGGSIDASNVTNISSLRTGGGSIRITGAKGKVRAMTGGGSIKVSGASDAVTAETGGGSVQVSDCRSDVRVITGGGSIDVGDVGGSTKVETGGGSIHLISASGPVVANTGGGSIELYKLKQSARAETGAGSITAEFLSVQSDSSLRTSAGDVIVYLSPQAKVTIRAELEMANGHKIRSDFPEIKITSEGGDWGPRNYRADGSLNGGGPVLRISAMSGNIELRRAK
ncbi:MAG: DUF4097 family beta strand repeat-containing protein [Terriglobales bacterium]